MEKVLFKSCPDCNGKGYESDGDMFGGTVECSTCNGSGEV